MGKEGWRVPEGWMMDGVGQNRKGESGKMEGGRGIKADIQGCSRWRTIPRIEMLGREKPGQ